MEWRHVLVFLHFWVSQENNALLSQRKQRAKLGKTSNAAYRRWWGLTSFPSSCKPTIPLIAARWYYLFVSQYCGCWAKTFVSTTDRRVGIHQIWRFLITLGPHAGLPFSKPFLSSFRLAIQSSGFSFGLETCVWSREPPFDIGRVWVDCCLSTDTKALPLAKFTYSKPMFVVDSET